MIFRYSSSELTPAGARACWLLANGLGGYMSTSVIASVTRGDQGVLISAKSPSRRYCLVHRLREVLETGGGSLFLSSQDFAGGSEPEDGYRRLHSFVFHGWPVWEYRAGDVTVRRRCAMSYGENAAAVVYEIENGSREDLTLRVTPMLQFAPKGEVPESAPELRYSRGQVSGGGLRLYAASSGDLRPITPRHELLRYADDEVDGRTGSGAASGVFEAVTRVGAGEAGRLEIVFSDSPDLPGAEEIFRGLRDRRRRLAELSGLRDPAARELARAADAFIASRQSGGGSTIIAGYPFFADWGRDTMIALPGCAMTTGRFDEARSVLRTFLRYELDGLVPNMFPEGGGEPLYNTADAALLLINCVWEYYRRCGDGDFVAEAYPVMERIVAAYRRGTRHAIRMDGGGLISAGEGLDQVTWMDVCVDGILPTPRHGKPVEINAYWYSALCIMGELAPLAGRDGSEYTRLAGRVRESFVREFWIDGKDYLRDVVSGTDADEQVRCNQIWAVAMPFTMLDPDRERKVVDTVCRHLHTTRGLRTLSPEDPQFHPVYRGTQRERDMAYHQGTVWPYPLGAFYLAYLKVYGHSPQALAQVRAWLSPMEAILREGCVGQLPEIYDGLTPLTSKGCFAQAWSVGEILRVYEEMEKYSSPPIAAG